MDTIKKAGRPKGTLSGKYRNELGYPIQVYEWRKLNSLTKRKEKYKLLGLKNLELKTYSRGGRPKGTLSGKYRNELGYPIQVYEWRKKHPEQKREYNLKNKEERRRQNVLKLYGLSLEEYKKIISQCAICKFKEYPCDLHHIDENKKNNSRNNFIGLCPNHHLGIHRGHFKYSQEELKRYALFSA